MISNRILLHLSGLKSSKHLIKIFSIDLAQNPYDTIRYEYNKNFLYNNKLK